MTPYQEQLRKRYLTRMVSNARAIITNQIGFPLGVVKMYNYINAVNNLGRLENIDLKIFGDYYIHLNSLPIGTERLEWNIEKLIEFEIEFDHINQQFKADLLRKCKEIINQLGSISAA